MKKKPFIVDYQINGTLYLSGRNRNAIALRSRTMVEKACADLRDISIYCEDEVNEPIDVNQRCGRAATREQARRFDSNIAHGRATCSDRTKPIEHKARRGTRCAYCLDPLLPTESTVPVIVGGVVIPNAHAHAGYCDHQLRIKNQGGRL